ncbi:hypothetical protein [Tsuneonella flava]|uniref:hypothetical protein n=1 Tax=Tsuneonella flava TaxID=2055955 RepID=UPI000F4BBDC5|nr:hypothetical protein [Tsuneonella flava]
MPDMTSGTPYCAGMAVWELPDYPVRLAAPSGAIVAAGGAADGADRADTASAIDVTLKTLGTPDEIAAFYRCALPYVGHDSVAPLPGGVRGFSYKGPDGRQGRVVLRVYDLPFPDDGWDTFIRITETQR